VDWRLAELKHHKVELRLNTLAERRHVLDEEPDLVIIATGGLPGRGPPGGRRQPGGGQLGRHGRRRTARR
jgi:hypothetical protein